MPVGVAGGGGMGGRGLVGAGGWGEGGGALAPVDPAGRGAPTRPKEAQDSSGGGAANLAPNPPHRALGRVSPGLISKADIDQRTANRDAANAKVKLAQAQYREMVARLGRLDIRAPASGLVLSRNVEPGQIVSSGSSALFMIAMDGALELQAKLAEQD